MGRRGRPRKSLAEHLAAGSYRKDRHGPLPDELRPKLVAILPRPGPDVAALSESFEAACQRVWRIDDPAGRAQVAVAAGALARLRALRALLDGPEGALAQLAVGGSTVRAASVTALVRAEESAARQFQQALSALGLAANGGAA